MEPERRHRARRMLHPVINPMMSVTSTIYIHAAPATAWAFFSRLEDWPVWNSEILEAGWIAGAPWQEASRFRLRHRSLLGTTATTDAILNMVVSGQVAVWESHAMGMTLVNTARFDASSGGCRLTASHTYHGAPALLLRLVRRRQQRTLERAMHELKRAVEESIQPC